MNVRPIFIVVGIIEQEVPYRLCCYVEQYLVTIQR